jgi:hypothetical protein
MPGEEKTIQQLEAELALARRAADTGDVKLPSSAPQPVQSSDPYAATSWGESGYDFRTPSGQLCRMRKLDPAKLAASGILDKITRLPAISQAEIDRAQGLPPEKQAEMMPDASAITALVEVLDIIVPLAVEKPQVYVDPAEGEDRIPGRVYMSQIEFGDRVAIMERATGSVKAFDNFRE